MDSSHSIRRLLSILLHAMGLKFTMVDVILKRVSSAGR